MPTTLTRSAVSHSDSASNPRVVVAKVRTSDARRPARAAGRRTQALRSFLPMSSPAQHSISTSIALLAPTGGTAPAGGRPGDAKSLIRVLEGSRSGFLTADPCIQLAFAVAAPRHSHVAGRDR